jgi:iron complex outermembrane receptor protein
MTEVIMGRRGQMRWLFGSAAALAMASPAFAQSVETADQGEEEILVTAQRRTEALKDVPISITTLGSEELEVRRVTGVEDYIESVPNATFINVGSYWGKNVTFRGISDFSGGNYDVISVTVDDVGFGSTNSSSILSSRLNDIERIEILRGPQGTLTGRNALGGAINIITNKPDPTGFDGTATLDYGRFNTAFGKLVLNIPLSETAAIRTSGFYEHSDGAIKNIGPIDTDSGYDDAGGRIALRLKPIERLTIDAAIGYERLDRDMENWVTHDFADPTFPPSFAIPTLESWGGAYPGPIDYFEDVGNNGAEVSKDTDEFTKIKDWTGSLRIAYEFDPITIDLIYGHFDYRLRYREDYDQTEYAWWNSSRTRKNKSDSVELRVTSTSDGPINWVAGVSYMDEKLINTQIDHIGIWATQGGLPRYNAEGGYTDAYIAYARNDLRSFGVFGNLFWDISEDLHLSAGLRYSVERNRLGDNFLFDIANPNNVLPPLTEEEYRRSKIDRWSPRIALTYDVTDRVSVYAQYSTGFRAGYGNTQQAISVGAPADVGPESLKNYEVGFKGQLIPRLLTVNAAAFYMDYSRLQVQALLPQDTFPFDIFYDLNGGKAHTKGFEVEAELRPTPDLRLQTAVGYTKAVVDEITVNGTPFENVPVPNVRPWTVSVVGHWTPRITDEITGNLRAEYKFQDRLYWQGILPNPAYFIPSYQTVDVSAGIDTRSYSVSLYFDNILNEKYFTSVGWTNVGFRGRMVYTPPRTYGIRVTAKLGELFGR